MRFVFDISLAVRPDEPDFKQELESVLDRKQAAIDSVLSQYGVPLLPRSSAERGTQ
jgi:hypothetical protein